MTIQVPPSINEAAFNCPHCGAYTTQSWFYLVAKSLGEPPHIHGAADREDFENDSDIPENVRQKLLAMVDKTEVGDPFIETMKDEWSDQRALNLHLSSCFHCKRTSVWVHRKLVHPQSRNGPMPNADLPDDIRRDVEEARSIVNASPRGAAALLRLALQKLCKFLGESGEDINRDIGELVKKGLNPLVQQALDIVRVIGNESVHPGTLDIRDDQDTATQLFGLINAIAEQMISHPKSVQALYAKLPANKLAGIVARDAKAKGTP